MKHFGALVGATILTAISTAAAACPDYNQYGAEYSFQALTSIPADSLASSRVATATCNLADLRTAPATS